MLNVCPSCGEYSTDPQIQTSGPAAVCASCGFRQKFLRLPLFVVTGASGTGKSTVARHLVGADRDYVCFDADVLWDPRYETRADGLEAFQNLLLRVATNISQSGRPVVLLAGGIPDQFEASPERRYFADTHYLALVCEDAELVARLQARPAWRKSGSPQVLARERSYNQWLRQNGSTTMPPMTIVESCGAPEADTARRVADWIAATRRQGRAGLRI